MRWLARSRVLPADPILPHRAQVTFMSDALSSNRSSAPSHYRGDRCLMCRSKNIQLALPLASSAIGNDYFPKVQPQEEFALSLWMCNECCNVQIEDIVNPDILFRSYTYSTTSSLGLVKHFRQYAEEAVRRTGATAGSLVHGWSFPIRWRILRRSLNLRSPGSAVQRPHVRRT